MSNTSCFERRCCGRCFTEHDLRIIREIIAAPERHPNRAAIARAVCEALAWNRPDGRPKEMSARVALLRMHRDGLITLPPPLHGNSNGKCRPQISSASDPRQPVVGSRSDLGVLRLRPVANRRDSRLWNELIERYHYLGFVPLPGAQIRYLIEGDGLVLGALGMGAAAWKVACRDGFIGWTPAQRQARLHLVVNNARFLILPWVQVKNLASSVLGLLARQVTADWEQLYGFRPVLLETFVERERFRGTCYQAANWRRVGCTQGRGKLDRHHRRALPVKDVYLYPLRQDFRRVLAGEEAAT